MGGRPMGGRYVSVYLRKSFRVPRAALRRGQGLLLRAFYDDGFVAYLNGREIQRANLHGSPGSHVSFDALASFEHEAEEFEEFEVPLRLLHTGRNTLAIQVHQTVLTSSDLSLDVELAVVEKLPSGSREIGAPSPAAAESLTRSLADATAERTSSFFMPQPPAIESPGSSRATWVRPAARSLRCPYH